MRELDFRQNKVEVLTLDELAQTAHEDYHNGLPCVMTAAIRRFTRRTAIR